MNIAAGGILSRLRAWFPDREFFMRSQGQVRFIKVTPGLRGIRFDFGQQEVARIGRDASMRAVALLQKFRCCRDRLCQSTGLPTWAQPIPSTSTASSFEA